VGDVRIGTSGWLYPPWRGQFYPPRLPHRRELEYISRRLRSVEINGSFYSLQRPDSYRNWASATPDDFEFAVKGSRFITHMKKLREPVAALSNFFASGLLALGPKLGPILWQLPPNFGFDLERLEEFFAVLPRDSEAAAELASHHDHRLTEDRVWLTTDARRPLRHALEVRHFSFLHDERFLPLVRRHDIALVTSDGDGRWPYFEELTASDFAYLRLHGQGELYVSGYTDETLDAFAEKIARWRDGRTVYVYFDNDVKTRAPVDARALASRLGVLAPEDAWTG
jgi:uncharacterized protein YecE (DUF72 family)